MYCGETLCWSHSKQTWGLPNKDHDQKNACMESIIRCSTCVQYLNTSDTWILGFHGTTIKATAREGTNVLNDFRRHDYAAWSACRVMCIYLPLQVRALYACIYARAFASVHTLMCVRNVVTRVATTVVGRAGLTKVAYSRVIHRVCTGLPCASGPWLYW